ncbi:MAG: hypothetical protein PHY09_16555 [Desulfuromonadaceae bacterium]|nr:hypothetical protein [Desulfuromonadaceae bacterium]MDD5106929.1 hypothetical protein [Desulfuromonadaceae bacterium]
MTKSLLMIALGLTIFGQSAAAVADEYDDCKAACRNGVVPCIDQVKISAGNIQEEEDMIAACKKESIDCIQRCDDAETKPTPAAPPEKPAEE